MSQQGSSPASPGRDLGFPENGQLYVFEQFTTLNTKALRPGIKDEEMSWCDGFMPIGPNNLRTLYGIGPQLYSTPSGQTIPFFGFSNLGPTPISVVLLSDGSVQQVNTNTGMVTEMAPPGTITNPSPLIGLSAWGNQYVLFSANQPNGYWAWDGLVLYGAGTLGPGVDITDGGSGYTAPTITATGGSGSGATFIATVTDGIITAIIITNPGSGYVVGDGPTLVITDPTGTGATANISIMSFGVSGTGIETYSGHVWIINGALVQFSAPDSLVDFSSANGGGAFTSRDSFLNVGFTFLKQSNGFLYTGADSSLGYISGVNTAPNSDEVPVTTFQNQNVDPQIGTPWPGALQVYSRNLVFGNSLGIFVSYGGAVTKISEPLDGIYNTVPNFGTFLPSSAVANIFGIEVYMQLTPVIDSYTGQQINKLLMWSGKAWFTSQQDVPLTYIASQKINSVLTAWGTNGSVIYPLFQQPSIVIQKVAQSKLWSTQHYLYTKTANRLYGVLNYYDNDNEPVNVTIDNEIASDSYEAPGVGNVISWTNNSGDTISWVNASDEPISWIINGITVFGPLSVTQSGRMLGMTVVTNASDLSVISTTLLNQLYSANV